jgi:hypothetical protein
MFAHFLQRFCEWYAQALPRIFFLLTAIALFLTLLAVLDAISQPWDTMAIMVVLLGMAASGICYAAGCHFRRRTLRCDRAS